MGLPGAQHAGGAPGAVKRTQGKGVLGLGLHCAEFSQLAHGKKSRTCDLHARGSHREAGPGAHLFDSGCVSQVAAGPTGTVNSGSSPGTFLGLEHTIGLWREKLL